MSVKRHNTIALGLLKNRKKKEECQIVIFYFARSVGKFYYYSDVIHSFDWKSAVQHMVVFKMRDSVPSVRYSIFVMYCVYKEFCSSLLIMSTDYMIYITQR